MVRWIAGCLVVLAVVVVVLALRPRQARTPPPVTAELGRALSVGDRSTQRPPASRDRVTQPPSSPPASSLPPPLAPPPTLRTGNPALMRFVTKEISATGPGRLGGDFLELVPRIDTTDERAAVAYVMEDWSDDDAIRNEAMNLLRRSGDEALEARLIALLARWFESERMRAFFLQHLGTGFQLATAKQRPPIRDRLVAALTDRHLAVRREAFSTLAEARDPAGLELLAHGPAAVELLGMHDLAIYLCHRLDAREHLPVIRGQVADADQEVKVAAIYVLGQWHDAGSRPALAAAAASTIHAVRRAGELALQRLDVPLTITR